MDAPENYNTLHQNASEKTLLSAQAVQEKFNVIFVFYLFSSSFSPLFSFSFLSLFSFSSSFLFPISFSPFIILVYFTFFARPFLASSRCFSLFSFFYLPWWSLCSSILLCFKLILLMYLFVRFLIIYKYDFFSTYLYFFSLMIKGLSYNHSEFLQCSAHNFPRKIGLFFLPFLFFIYFIFYLIMFSSTFLFFFYYL